MSCSTCSQWTAACWHFAHHFRIPFLCWRRKLNFSFVIAYTFTLTQHQLSRTLSTNANVLLFTLNRGRTSICSAKVITYYCMMVCIKRDVPRVTLQLFLCTFKCVFEKVDLPRLGKDPDLAKDPRRFLCCEKHLNTLYTL